MKKLYIIGLMGLGLVANAQKSETPAANNNTPLPAVTTKKVDYELPSPVRINNRTPRPAGYNKVATWNTVGQTRFDRQTNSSVYRRIQAYPNGKVSVVWTTSTDGSNNNFLGRGSGYNHFNGVTWGPVGSERIEQQRTGYPNFDFDGTTEIIMSHKVDTAGKSGGLAYNTNGGIGGTSWTTETVLPPLTNQPSVLWPRTVVANGYMHVLANYTSPASGQTDTVRKAGVLNPTVYSRYNFSNSTWDVVNVTLPGYDSTRWVNGGADGYALDARGSNVAILMGGSSDDISLWKSTDNGDTWTNTILDSFPVPAFVDQELILDTPVVCDGSLNVRIDSTGNAHCFWGRLRVLNTSTTDNTSSVFLGTNAIDYWYEGRPDSIVFIASAFDENNNGTLNVGTIDSRSRYGNAGVSTMPYSIIDESGRIFVVYSALTDEDLDAQGAAFRDVYLTTSSDNGATWSFPQNLTAFMGFNVEQMFGSAAILNDTMHLTFMESDVVGFFSTTDNASKVGPFDIIHLSLPIADIDNGKVGLDETNNLLTVGTNYPNPFRNSTVIPVNLTQKADVKVTVMNILGEVVYSNTYNNTTTGVNNIEVNGNFKSGFYFYNIEAAGVKVSGKMLAE
jgi:hypothetical protein